MTRGANSDREMTQGEVAEALGISKSLVAMIERQALQKLKAAFEAEGLSFEDLCPAFVPTPDEN